MNLNLNKLQKIAKLIGNSFATRYILLRDQAFLQSSAFVFVWLILFDFFRGGADLGRCVTHTCKIKRTQNDDGLLFTHPVGKTVSN